MAEFKAVCQVVDTDESILKPAFSLCHQKGYRLYADADTIVDSSTKHTTILHASIFLPFVSIFIVHLIILFVPEAKLCLYKVKINLTMPSG
jgi:hypothetical protein